MLQSSLHQLAEGCVKLARNPNFSSQLKAKNQPSISKNSLVGPLKSQGTTVLGNQTSLRETTGICVKQPDKVMEESYILDGQSKQKHTQKVALQVP